MRIPGFSAEAALSPPRHYYASLLISAGNAAEQVVLAGTFNPPPSNCTTECKCADNCNLVCTIECASGSTSQMTSCCALGGICQNGACVYPSGTVNRLIGTEQFVSSKEANGILIGEKPAAYVGVRSADVPDDRSIGVLYATNRVYELVDRTPGFFSRRTKDITYGSAIVRIPEEHRLGFVERPVQLSVFGIVLQGEEKPRKHFLLQRVTRLTEQEFITCANNSVEKSALLFVHGYNTDFREAIFRLAQIAWDMQYRGIPIAFSWPSKGGVADYDYDRGSAEFSKVSFLQVLKLVFSTNIKKVFIVAHSLGNQIVIESLALLRIPKKSPKLSELVFAAPDVDRQVFESHIPFIINRVKGITLYASAADKALLASQLKAQAPRAGYIHRELGPLLVSGVETIDVTAVGNDMFALNHGTYSSARSVLDDLGRLVITGIHPPNLRSPHLRGVPEGSAQPKYWRYPE